MNLQWWGYLHVNGTIKVKRYWDEPRDIEDAKESTFVKKVILPFEAENKEDAVTIIMEKLKN